MQVTVRIDGNKNYVYAKEHLTLIDNVIYVVEKGYNSRLSLHLLNDGYIEYAHIKYSNNVTELLKLIKEHYYDIVVAIKFVEINGGIREDIGNIQGFTISDW